MERAHRTVVAGVHRLQQIERLGSAHFAHDDALGAHTQAVLDQVTHGDLALTLEIGRAGFEAHHMRLLQLQFGRVLAGDDALVLFDEAGEAVEQSGLARTGTAGDQDVGADATEDAQHFGAFGRNRAVLDQLRQRQLVFLELTDGERGAVDGQRRGDDVDARAIGQAGVADRRALIDATADLADDALADVHQMGVVAEADIGQLHLAGDLDVAFLAAVHHDVGDVVAGQQRLQRAIAEHVVADILEQVFLLGDRHDDRLERDDLGDDVANFLARRFLLHGGELAQIDRVDQRVEDRRLGLEILLVARRSLGAAHVEHGAIVGAPLGIIRLPRQLLPGRGNGGRHRRAGRLRGAGSVAAKTGTLAEHLGRAFQARFFMKDGSFRPGFLEALFSGALRPVTCMPMARNTSLARLLAATSAIIWPLLAAVPKVAASKPI